MDINIINYWVGVIKGEPSEVGADEAYSCVHGTMTTQWHDDDPRRARKRVPSRYINIMTPSGDEDLGKRCGQRPIPGPLARIEAIVWKNDTWSNHESSENLPDNIRMRQNGEMFEDKIHGLQYSKK